MARKWGIWVGIDGGIRSSIGSQTTVVFIPWSWGPEDGKYATTGICHPGHEEEVSGDRSAQAPYHPRDIAGDEAGVAATPQPEGCSHVMGSIHNVLLRLPAAWRGCGPRGEQVRSDSAPSDVRVNSYQDPQFLQVRIKASKTDPYHQGATIYLGKAPGELCPVAAVLGYMVGRGTQPGPFFRFTDGRGIALLRPLGGY